MITWKEFSVKKKDKRKIYRMLLLFGFIPLYVKVVTVNRW